VQTQFTESRLQPFSYDAALAQPHIIHSVRLVLVTAIPQIIDQEHAHYWQGQKCFSRPCLDQVGRHHRQSRERLSFAINMDRPERDQGLAGATLRDNCDLCCKVASTKIVNWPLQ
jgi:hypothetical protein